MYKSPLKVYDEYLVPATNIAASIPAGPVLRLGGGLPGLELVVCAEPSAADLELAFELKVGTEVTIAALHSQDGETFVALPEWKQVIAAPLDEPSASTLKIRPGEIIARFSLPVGCLPFVKAGLKFAAGSGGAIPSGRVSLFPSYLPR